MDITVVGAGYVGLVTAACFSSLGHRVRCIDADAARIGELSRGRLPIHEPGLDELVSEQLRSGQLSFHAERIASHGTELIVLAVGTLDHQGDWTPRYVREAVLSYAADPRAPRAMVIRSTLLPGTAVGIAAEVAAVDPRVELAVNPEFTREATAVRDFLAPDRVVVGVVEPGVDSAVSRDLRRLYDGIDAPFIATDLTSAETIKVASNVFLSAKITFANELARLCAAVGANVDAVVDGMGLDARIGRSFLSPGPGFGGSCFPSQATALPRFAAANGVSTPLMAAITPSNVSQADWLIDRLEALAGHAVDGQCITVLGLTFKAGTGDLRDSPALRIAERLVDRGARVAAFDPVATEAGVRVLRARGLSIKGCSTALEALDGADAVVVATEWPEFRSLHWDAVAPLMRGRLIVDARRVVDVQAALTAGFHVISHGVTVGV